MRSPVTTTGVDVCYVLKSDERPRHRGGGGLNEKGDLLLSITPGALFCFYTTPYEELHEHIRSGVVTESSIWFLDQRLLLHQVTWPSLKKNHLRGILTYGGRCFPESCVRGPFSRTIRDVFKSSSCHQSPLDPPPNLPIHVVVRVCDHSSCRHDEVCAPAPLGAAELLAVALDEDSLAELLRPVSFARTKVRRRRA